MPGLNTQIYEEASNWIVLHRSGSLDADSRQRFDAWLRESPLHVRAYLEMSSIWEDVPELSTDRNASADELIARARTDINVFPLDETSLDARTPGDSGVARNCAQKEGPRQRGLLYSIAASLMLAVGIAGWLYLQRGVYVTDIGEQRVIALADGSSIELNARSKIRIHYTEEERGVDLLWGQALFRVAKDPERSFVVGSAGTRVRAVGTEFDVYQKLTGTVVTVVEGRVAVLASIFDKASSAGISGRTRTPAGGAGTAAPDEVGAPSPARRNDTSKGNGSVSRPGAVYLSAGERIIIAPTADAVPQPANVEAATAWTRQRLVFDFAPLTEVAEEFNRYNRRPLVIDDSSPQDFHISGSFSSTDPTLLLRFLRAQPGIAVTETTREIRISRRETGPG